MYISSVCQVTQQQPVAQNFGGFYPFPSFQQFSPFEQFPQYQSRQNFNQNFERNSRLTNQDFGQTPVFATTTAAPTTSARVVIVNNQPTVPTMVPFMERATTPTPQFLDCFSRCPTTSEFNPVCASNREQYGNEQKFICAQRCGAGM